MSKYYEHRAYVLAQDCKSKDVPSDHVKLFTFNTDRALNPEQKFTPELYATFWWFNGQGEKHGDYEVRLDRFYIKEQKKDIINVYNFGDELSVAFDADISTHTRPIFESIYWQYNEDLDLN